MYKVFVCVLAIILTRSFAVSGKISQTVLQALEHHQSVDIIVSMRDKTFSTIANIKLQKFANREAQLYGIAGGLKSLAQKSQKPVLAMLTMEREITFKSLWISNKISIKNANFELIRRLVQMTDIGSIEEDAVIPLHLPVQSSRATSSQEDQWGLDMIEARAVWAQGYTGNGVVVATIDTGVRYTHKSLYSNFRQTYGWFDPYNGTDAPIDIGLLGHGTHTLGTIAGSHGIGVAPGSTWISCRGCEIISCTLSAIEACGQFMLCPTYPDGSKEDCSKAPHLVSSSWGFYDQPGIYNEVLAAWEAAGIIPIFANGNDGPKCNTTAHPADSQYTPVIAVGATDVNDLLSEFSSLGPSVYGAIKPDIAGPGVNILSAYNGDDEGFHALDGTSMAAPHVAGVIALLLTNGTQLNYDDISALLFRGATHTVNSTGGNCGGVSESEYPNNHVGWGRLSALNSLNKLLEGRFRN